MQNLKSFLILFLFLFFYSSFSFAVEPPIFKGEEVVVTAARYLQFKSESPWSVTVLDYEDLEATGGRSLGEALRSALGMDIKSNGYQGAVTSFKLRGVAAEQVLILVDGMRVASPLLGVADATDMLIHDIERVEVVRGASSSLYGSDAIGGVIAVITKRPSKAFEVSGNILYGTYNTQQIALSVQGKGPVGYQFSGSLDKTEGFRENSDAEQQNYSGKLIFDLGGDELTLGLGYYRAFKGLPNVPSDEAHPYSASTPGDKQSDENAYYNVAYKKQFGRDSNFEIRAYQTQQVQSTHIYDFWALDFVDSDYISFTNALEFQHVLKTHRNNMLTYGLDWREEKGRSFYAGDHSISNLALYIQDELRPLDNLFLTLGTRGDSHSKSGDFISPRIGIVVKSLPWLDLRSSYGVSFRSPTLNQLYWNDPVWLMYGDEDLRPEKADSFDFGLVFRFGNVFNFNLGYFTNTITDMIVWHYDGGTFTTTASNIDTAVIQGAEFAIDNSVTDWFKYSINYTSQRPVRVYDKRLPSLVGKDLPYAPRDKGNVSISVGNRRSILLDLIGKYVGERYADGANTEKLDSYTTFDAKLTKSMGRIDYYLQVENAFDVEYYESVGFHPTTWTTMKYPMPGRRILFGVKCNVI